MSKIRKIGEVVGTNSKDTIVVKIVERVSHPLYEKIVTRVKKYVVHAPNHELQIGDIVEIAQSRPISKIKKWIYISKVK